MMPSDGWVWAMVCYWTVLGSITLGYVVSYFRRATRALEEIAETYRGSP